MQFREIPSPNYARDTDQLIKYYKEAFKDIASKMAVMTNGIERQMAESLLSQISFILRQLDANADQWVRQTITATFTEAQAQTLVSLGVAATLTEATGMVAFSMLARDTVESIISDTYGDLLLATQNTERKIKQLVRNVVSDTMRVRAVEQYGRRITRNEIVDRLTRAGLSKKLDAEAWVGIVDKAGRRWNLSTYSEMVVRTKLQQAHVEGVRVEALDRGVDLAVISTHGATDPCRNFEGMVISMNGLTPGYKTYAELRASGKIFHPNCGHHITPLRDIELLPKPLREKHERAMELAEKALT